ncbi:ArsR family transcriptional regulator [[Clostridium] sordellii]|uniref:ArsR/SmtB family transcription factor n=1 Tax=Paraclostridium sordellii TaxID=1505 RepID=UPI000385D9F9|nr:metalloregulator ArsR/SmtB family transcription factor [Paeniclostridium sordellii]EPZ57789.1 bacterial regulatory, arsR family protein [[Clostridium] sordellii VPI 9048] [Paeniclostridium sordellii VPI 9048]CEK37638.1 Transcriptional regulator, ArsR family [[Clostridium] sordellii] [Paeniclostridium sordellii]CEP80024.1 ArsR family transcriptional regulator [[Clostridium] sordellii] [Paeniclostridium sordellii]CEQ30522.1 ArsR family transcriptional regulator [[Clostridium] sordellii] [Paeni
MEKECEERLKEITSKFKLCQKAISAMGDETRQLILLTLLESDFNGIRVGEITEKTHLSRPAVSHHLKILKEAEIVNVRKEGTKNFYYLDSKESQWKNLTELINLIFIGVQHISKDDTRKGE